MARFIQLKDGLYVNGDRIITLRTRKVAADEAEFSTAVEVEYLGADGGVCRGEAAGEIDASGLAETFGAVIPAVPGFYGVELGNGPANRVAREPVLAWRLESYGMEAIGFSGGILSDVLCPDGSVQNLGECWASLEDWRQDKVAERAMDDDEDEDEEGEAE